MGRFVELVNDWASLFEPDSWIVPTTDIPNVGGIASLAMSLSLPAVVQDIHVAVFRLSRPVQRDVPLRSDGNFARGIWKTRLDIPLHTGCSGKRSWGGPVIPLRWHASEAHVKDDCEEVEDVMLPDVQRIFQALPGVVVGAFGDAANEFVREIKLGKREGCWV